MMLLVDSKKTWLLRTGPFNSEVRTERVPLLVYSVMPIQRACSLKLSLELNTLRLRLGKKSTEFQEVGSMCKSEIEVGMAEISQLRRPVNRSEKRIEVIFIITIFHITRYRDIVRRHQRILPHHPQIFSSLRRPAR